MAAEETSIFLSYLPSSRKPSELNKVGCFRMSVLDYLSQFEPSVAQGLGFTAIHWSSYTSIPPIIRRKYLLEYFLVRLRRILQIDDEAGRFLLKRGALQLTLLEDNQGALTMYEQFLAPESRVMDVPFFRGTCCSGCNGKNAPLF